MELGKVIKVAFEVKPIWLDTLEKTGGAEITDLNRNAHEHPTKE